MKWYKYDEIKPPMGLEVLVRIDEGEIGLISSGLYNGIHDHFCINKNGYGFNLWATPTEWAFLGEENIYTHGLYGDWELDPLNENYKLNPEEWGPISRSEILSEMRVSRRQGI